jgi:hypothetical protein
MYYHHVVWEEELEQQAHEQWVRSYRAQEAAEEAQLRAELDAELERIDRELALIGFQNSQEFAQVPR